MPPPVSYIDITSLPFTRVVTQAEFNAANEIWFRYVATVNTVLGGQTNSGGTFVPETRLFLNDGTTQRAAGVVSNVNGWWWYLTPDTYYIRVRKSGGGASDFDFTSQFAQQTADPTSYSNGAYLISDDDSDQWPACLMEEDGTVLGFIAAVPTCEIGMALPSGYILFYDERAKYAANSVILFNPSLAIVATITPSPALSGWPFFTSDGTYFYVINGGGADIGDVYRIDTTGAIVVTGVTVPIAVVTNAVGINRAADTYYWAEDSSADIKKRTGGVTSTFYTVPGFVGVDGDEIARNPNGNPGEILILPDGTLVTWWLDDSLFKNYILHIAANGTLINTWEFDYTDRKINHIHPDQPESSTHIRIWFFLDGLPGEAIFARLKLSDGTLENSITVAMFSDTKNNGTGSLREVMFGAGDSCPFVVLAASSGFTAGVNIMVPGRLNDLDEAIPTPSFTISLLGD